MLIAKKKKKKKKKQILDAFKIKIKAKTLNIYKLGIGGMDIII